MKQSSKFHPDIFTRDQKCSPLDPKYQQRVVLVLAQPALMKDLPMPTP